MDGRKLMALVLWGIILVIAYLTTRFKSRVKSSGYLHTTGNKANKIRNNKGLYGEFLVFETLSKISKMMLLANVYIPDVKGGITEVDIIGIHPTGIYVFESKNLSGTIFCKTSSDKWIQRLDQGRDIEFYSPLKQNKWHIDALNKFLEYKYENKYISYVVIGDETNLVLFDWKDSEKELIVKRKDIKKKLREKINNADIKLGDSEIKYIYEKLHSCTLENRRY